MAKRRSKPLSAAHKKKISEALKKGKQPKQKRKRGSRKLGDYIVKGAKIGAGLGAGLGAAGGAVGGGLIAGPAGALAGGALYGTSGALSGGIQGGVAGAATRGYERMFEAQSAYVFPGTVETMIEFKRKRKPMAAATKKKIAQALERANRRRKRKKVDVSRSTWKGATRGAALGGALGTVGGLSSNSIMGDKDGLGAAGTVASGVAGGVAGALGGAQTGAIIGGGLGLARKYGGRK